MLPFIKIACNKVLEHVLLIDPMEKPLMTAAFSYAAGVFFSPYLPQVAWFWGVLSVVFLLLTAYGVKNPLTGWRRCLVLVLFCTALFNVSIHHYYSSPVKNQGSRLVSFRGTVVSQPELKNRQEKYVLKDEAGKKFLLCFKGRKITYGYGDILEGEGKVEPLPGPANPGSFSYGDYLQRKGIAYTVYAVPQNVHRTAQGKGNLLIGYALKSKAVLTGLIERSLPQDQSSLLKGILFGETSSIPPETVEWFRGSGLSHILSVSGLHISLLLGLVWPFSLKVFRREGVAVAFSALSLLFYAFMTGLEPPVLRALVMGVAVLLAGVTRNSSNSRYNLCGAGLLVLIINPMALFNPGFQLSFAATGAIISLGPAIQKALSFLPAWLANNLSVTIAAQIGVLPLLARYFNEIPLLATGSNLVAIPLVWAVTVLGLLSCAVGLVHESLSYFLNLSTGALLWLLTSIAHMVANVPGGTFIVKTPPIFASALFYLGLYVCFKFLTAVKFRQHLRFWRFRAGSRIAVPALVLAALLLWGNIIFALPSELKVVFLDVGEGDAIFVRTPAGLNILLDTGHEKAGKLRVLPFLKREGVEKLDYLILTHGHEDHVGGVPTLLAKLKVKNIITPPASQPATDNKEKDLLKDLLASSRAKNVSWSEVSSGDSLHLDSGVRLEILSPPEEMFQDTRSDANSNSLVIKMIYGKIDLLLAADAEKETIDYLKENGKVGPVEIYKVPHHGSRFSLDEEFLSQLGAEYAVISVGPNLFGHPDLQVIEALHKVGMKLLRTDRNGAVTVLADGSNFSVTSMED